MRTLYLECNMGAAGDMLMAALLELILDKDAFLDKLNGLKIPNVRVSAEPSVKCGIVGTHVSVLVHGEEEDEQHHHEHEHEHAGMGEIEHLLMHLDLPEKVREDALAVYKLLAKAESEVHGRPVTEVHFHEVGMMDAVMDIVGVCMLMHELKPKRVIASPVHVGSGQVKCAHGLLPVPAPATVRLLLGIPTYGGNVRGELCTPTGAALLRHFVSEFCPMPPMKVEKIGYGMGKKDFEAANCVRAMLGTEDSGAEKILELSCNLDDMTPEAVGFAMERLLDLGALDVFTVPIGMKKSRPAVLLSCLCRLEQRGEMLKLLFKHTTTLGVREYVCDRHVLSRSERVEKTEYGTVRVKEAEGFGVKREKPEFGDLARIARERGISLIEAAKLVK
ncbi:MAG TPA: nickel pincer cofactor biosynthesis protein LarC [Clostridia bacterium]|nr:nickel pincer cofactor biosynthesis protein LarC [Clostridia bacterium]